MASASKTKAVAATATASDGGEHASLQRHRGAGELRVAQEEIGALSRPLLLTIAMSPLLTISAGFESIEMSPADVYIARYSAAAIHPNHQKRESHFVVDGGPGGETVCGISLMSSTIFHETY
jgi:hypothetical protein